MFSKTLFRSFELQVQPLVRQLGVVSRNFNKRKAKISRHRNVNRRRSKNWALSNVSQPNHGNNSLASTFESSNSDSEGLDKLAELTHDAFFSSSSDEKALQLDKLKNVNVEKKILRLHLKDLKKQRAFDYNEIMRAQIVQGNNEGALRTYERMALAGVNPNEQTFVNLVSACFNSDDVDGAKQVYASLRNKAMGDIDLDKLRKAQEAADPNDVSPNNPLLWKPPSRPFFRVHAAVVNGLVKCGRLGEALELVSEMEEDGEKLYGEIGYQEGSVWPTSDAYSGVIAGTYRKRDYKTTWKLYRRMLFGGTLPNAHILSTMISVCARTEEPEHALKLFEEHADWELEPCRVSYHAVMYACSRSLRYNRETFWLYHQMKSEGIVPDLRTYNILLHACSLSGDVVVAKQILRQLQADGVAPCSYTYSAMLNCYARSQRWRINVPDPNQPKAPRPGLLPVEKSEPMQRKMEYVIGREIEPWEYNKNEYDFRDFDSDDIDERSGNDTNDYVTQYTTKEGPTDEVMKDLLWAKGSSAFGLQAITEEREANGEVFGPETTHLISHAEAQMGVRTNFKKPNLRKMKSLPLPFLSAAEGMNKIAMENANEKVASSSVQLLSSGEEEGAESTPVEVLAQNQLRMLSSPESDSNLSSSTPWSATEVEQNSSVATPPSRCDLQTQNIEEATKLFESMIEYGIEPTEHTLNAYLKVFTEARRFKQAENLLNLFPKFGVEPSGYTYGPLIKGLAQIKHGKMLPKALEYKKLMDRKGLKMSASVYGILLNRLAHNNQLEDALKMLHEARNQHGLEPPEKYLAETRKRVRKIELRLQYETRPEHPLIGFEEGKEKERMEDLMLLALESLPPEPYWWVKTELAGTAQRSKSKELGRTKARIGRNLFAVGSGRGFPGMG
eukprot:g3214.t1